MTNTSLKRVPHAYTTPSSPDSARCWVPCVDNLWEKCTWEFEFIVPRYLEERQPVQEEEEDDQSDASPTLVVCSGELVEQVSHQLHWFMNLTRHHRLPIQTIQIKPSSSSHKPFSRLFNTLLSLQAHFTSSPSPLTAPLTILPVHPSPLCTPSVYQATNPSSSRPLHSFAPL